MTPISSNMGWITHKHQSAGASTAVNPSFNQQLQSLLQQTKQPAPEAIPSPATVGHMHVGGMNDVAHQLLALAGH